MRDTKKKTIYTQLIGIAVARAGFMGMNPFAMGYFIVAYLEGSNKFIFISVLIGLASKYSPGEYLKYVLAMVLTMLVMESPFVKKRNTPSPVAYGIPILFVAIFSFWINYANLNRGEYIILSLIEILLTYISAFIFYKGFYLLHDKESKHTIDNEDLISLILIIAVATYGIPDFPGSRIALVETIVYFIVLLFTYKYGAGQGTVTAVICGLIMMLKGNTSIGQISLLPVMAILSSLFRDLGRLPTGTIYMLAAIIMNLFYQEEAIDIRSAGAILSAVLIFILLPKQMVKRVNTTFSKNQKEPMIIQNIKGVVGNRMNVFSDSFLKLSKSIDLSIDKEAVINMNDINSIFEDVSEKLCKGCENNPYCWEECFKETYDATNQMFELAQKNGVITLDDIPKHFLSSCISVEDFVTYANRGFELAKLNQIWHNKMAQSKEIMAEQLKEVSQAVHDFSNDLNDKAERLYLEEKNIVYHLKKNHVIIKNLYVMENQNKHIEVYLEASCKKGHCITTKDVARLIGSIIGIPVSASERTKSVISKDVDMFLFVEDTKFKVLTGMSRAVKDTVSGDNFSLLKLEKGNMVILLSDGMGSGSEASAESELVIGLLEQFLEAGFNEKRAIKLINSSLILKAGEQSFTTVDMGVINLYTGICEFIKLGAATTFIKRGNWVETISSTTMPIGMLNELDYDCVSKKLYEGDMVIMVTDGVLDAIPDYNKEEIMKNLIMEINSNNPQTVSNQILDQTLGMCNYIPMDDMTVITAGIWLK